MGELEVPPQLGLAVEPLLLVLEQVNEEIAGADRALKQRVKEGPDLRRLTTLPGAGPVSATTFKATIDEVERFRGAQQVAAYLGLVPRERSSGERQQRGRITNDLFATLLIPPPEKALDREAALAWLTHNLPEYESLAAHLLRRLLQELDEDTSADAKLGNVQFRAAALYLLQRDVQTMAWACSGVIGGLPPVVIKQGRKVEGIEDFQGTIVSALRLLVAEAGVVDPASGAFRELRAALARWQAREREAAAE